MTNNGDMRFESTYYGAPYLKVTPWFMIWVFPCTQWWDRAAHLLVELGEAPGPSRLSQHDMTKSSFSIAMSAMLNSRCPNKSPYWFSFTPFSTEPRCSFPSCRSTRVARPTPQRCSVGAAVRRWSPDFGSWRANLGLWGGFAGAFPQPWKSWDMFYFLKKKCSYLKEDKTHRLYLVLTHQKRVLKPLKRSWNAYTGHLFVGRHASMASLMYTILRTTTGCSVVFVCKHIYIYILYIQ